MPVIRLQPSRLLKVVLLSSVFILLFLYLPKTIAMRFFDDWNLLRNMTIGGLLLILSMGTGFLIDRLSGLYVYSNTGALDMLDISKLRAISVISRKLEGKIMSEVRLEEHATTFKYTILISSTMLSLYPSLSILTESEKDYNSRLSSLRGYLKNGVSLVYLSSVISGVWFVCLLLCMGIAIFTDFNLFIYLSMVFLHVIRVLVKVYVYSHIDEFELNETDKVDCGFDGNNLSSIDFSAIDMVAEGSSVLAGDFKMIVDELSLSKEEELDVGGEKDDTGLMESKSGDTSGETGSETGTSSTTTTGESTVGEEIGNSDKSSVGTKGTK